MFYRKKFIIKHFKIINFTIWRTAKESIMQKYANFTI